VVDWELAIFVQALKTRITIVVSSDSYRITSTVKAMGIASIPPQRK
jgi:hypothetical protein